MWFLIICVLFVKLTNAVNMTDEEYALMPPIFKFDDFDHCLQLGVRALYCNVRYELEPLDPKNHSKVWQLISSLIPDGKYYRHDWLRHGICVPEACPNIPLEKYVVGDNNETLMFDIQDCMDEKYKDLGLKGVVTQLHCESTDPIYEIDSYDIAVAVSVAVFLSFVLLASFYEGLARYKPQDEYKRLTESTIGRRLLSSFSLVKNWQRLRSESANPDAVRMKSIQGVRFYNMACVIMSHTCMMIFHAPTSNPWFQEHTTDNTLNMFIANGSYVVQTFFAISGWLVAFHLFDMTEGKKYVSFGYIIFAFINRYIRLLPALLVTYLFHSTWMIHFGRGPFWDRVVGNEWRNCRENGWSNLLFINNYYNKEHMCLQHTWYMAVDSQVFVVAIIIAWFMKNNENHAWKIIFSSITVATAIPMVISYINKYDIIIRQYPEPLYELLLNVPQWHDMFASGYCNIAGYLVGVAFGYLFYKCRHRNVFESRSYQVMWWFAVWFVPLFIILIGGIMYDENFHYTRIGASLYIGISRTLFPVGITLAIFGFTQQQGWFMRWFTEWDAVQIFGRLTYCAYLIHTGLLRLRAGKYRYPIFATDYILFYDTLGDITLAYLVATALCLCVEMPISALQKLIIPQRKKVELERDIQLNGSGKRLNGDSSYKI